MSPSEAARVAESVLRADSQTLSAAQQLSLADARREIQRLLMHALDIDLAALLAHPERIPEARGSQRYLDLLARRLCGEPMAYILGAREFYGRSFAVSADVLIPRPETELLVDLALELIPEHSERRVLDLGTGSGCIGVTLAKQRREIKVIATDVSKAALAVAARNVALHAAYNVELRAGSWFKPVAGMRFDLIVSNPPYVAEQDPHLREGDLRFEPRTALSAGADGMTALNIIIADAPLHLKPGGWLMVEHGYDQSDAVVQLLRARGLGEILIRKDIAGICRIAVGRLLEGTP